MTEDLPLEVPKDKTDVIIFEGENISEFVDTAVLNKRAPLCQLSSGNCSVYEIPGCPVLVVVCQEKNLHLFSLIAELLKPFIGTASRISTITVQSAAQHKRLAIEDDPVCYLRTLNGSADATGPVKTLEPPNIITGVAAGVSLIRQSKSLSPAANYVFFMEAVVYDSMTTAPIIRLLKQLEVPCADEFRRGFKDESNLYL